MFFSKYVIKKRNTAEITGTFQLQIIKVADCLEYKRQKFIPLPHIFLYTWHIE